MNVVALALLLTLWPASAHADPISLIAAAITSLIGISSVTLPIIGAVTITQIVGAVVAGGLLAASLLFGGGQQQQQQIDPGKAKENFTGEESPELRAVGRVRLGGVVVFGNTIELRRYRLIAQCKGEIDGRENTYLGGQEVTILPSGLVASPPYFETASELSYVEVFEKDGDGTETAWSLLITEFPTLWTTNHRVRGICQALVKYRSPGFTNIDFARLYQGGVPQFEQVIRAEKVYDPRTELTKWSDNGILVALHVMLTWPEFTLDNFDLDFIAAEADRADELVEVNGGGVSPVPTEKRARAWGVWTSEMPRADVMSQLLMSIGAEIVSRPNDKIGIQLVDDDRDPEVTIPTRHIVELTWKSGPDSVERPNLCRVKYYSPERAYDMHELLLHEFDVYGEHVGPAWARIQSEIDAVGEKPMDIDLPFCPSAAQAQRIARRLFAQARADAGLATTNLVGLAAWGARTIALEMPDELGTHTAIIGPPRVLDDRGLVELPFIIQPTLTEWDPVVDSVPAPEVMPDFGQSDPMPTPDAPAYATVITYDGDTYTRIPGPIEETGTEIAKTEASYRTFNADGNPNHWLPFGLPVETVLNVPLVLEADIDLSGVLAEFRIRVFASGDRGSQWSESLLTTPVVDTAAPADPTIEAISGGGGGGLALIRVTAPSSYNVAYIQTTGDGSPGEVRVAPNEVISWTGNEPDTWTAQAFATGGAGSNIVSDTLP